MYCLHIEDNVVPLRLHVVMYLTRSYYEVHFQFIKGGTVTRLLLQALVREKSLTAYAATAKAKMPDNDRGCHILPSEIVCLHSWISRNPRISSTATISWQPSVLILVSTIDNCNRALSLHPTSSMPCMALMLPRGRWCWPESTVDVLKWLCCAKTL